MSANTTHTAVCPCCGYEHDTDARGQRKKFKDFAVYSAAPQMLEALRAQQAAHEALFSHCLSNGVFNARGKPLDCTTLNDAKLQAERAIAAAEGRT